MFTSNPYATVAGVLSADFMKWYVIVMILAVILGTLWDVIHKGSAKYFFATWKKTQDKGARPVSGGEMVSMAIQTSLVDVATSAEFCNQKRRLAHLLTMYGFILHMAATALMAFSYPTAATPTPALVTGLWWIGGLMLCLGGYWFWFFIRVDVSAEGSSPFRLMKADLFVLSLLASTTLGLLWAAAGGGVGVLFGLYLLATAVLFFGVPWSKFAHMFFKPAAALEKRIAKANGSANMLPTLTRDDPEQQKRHSMELLQNAPMDMGLGIKREAPRHY